MKKILIFIGILTQTGQQHFLIMIMNQIQQEKNKIVTTDKRAVKGLISLLLDETDFEVKRI